MLGGLAISGASSVRALPTASAELGMERAAASTLAPDAAESDGLDHERVLPMAALGPLAPSLARAFAIARATRADEPLPTFSAARIRPPNRGPPAA